MKRAAIIAVLLFAGQAWADDATSVELRYTGSRLTDGDDLEHDRYSIYAEREQSLFSTGDGAFIGSGKAAVLGFVDHVDPTRKLAIRELYVDVLAGGFSLRSGYQDIAWSETFGFFIADIVNPRDLRDALYLDPRYARLPVLAFKPQWVGGNFSLQGVVTPVARNTLYPQTVIDGVPVIAPAAIDASHIPDDLEAGARAEALLFDKLDCALFYFRHLNRNLALDQVVVDRHAALQAVTRKVDSLGLTSSLALESVVFREDLVYTLHQPTSATDFGPVRSSNEVQSILGIDYSSTSDFTFGAQYQFETHTQPFHWVSFRVSKKFAAQKLQPEIFVFKGVGNRDAWVEPQISWYASDRLTVSLRYDAVAASAQNSGDFEGYLSPLRKDDRVLAEFDYKL